MWHDATICVTWLSSMILYHTCDMTLWSAWHDSHGELGLSEGLSGPIVCVTWLIHLTLSYELHSSWLIYIVRDSYTQFVTQIHNSVTSLYHTCDMTWLVQWTVPFERGIWKLHESITWLYDRFHWTCYTPRHPPNRETQIPRYLAVQI